MSSPNVSSGSARVPHGSGTNIRIRQGTNALHANWFEAPAADAEQLEAWCYTGAMSYAPGDTVTFHVSTTAERFALTVLRDGLHPREVHRVDGIEGRWQETPADCSVVGCGWTSSYELVIPDDWPSGVYVVLTDVASGDQRRRHEHFFVVRGPGRERIALMLPTCTYTAYNHWGGSGSYRGITGPEGRLMSPRLSLERPWERGFVVKPVGAPRAVFDREAPMGWAPRSMDLEWSYIFGYAKWCAVAGWAHYDRTFAVWAEQQGYALEYLTQHDLHYRPKILDPYACVVVVGHDEYWSWEMRDAVEVYVARGGNLIRLAGNFLWQVRLENDGRTQVCYKHRARDEDSVRDDPERRHLLTEAWESSRVRRPGASTVGVNGAQGMYVRCGAQAPRHSGGFTVYRQDHWAFDGCDLYYGDTFGTPDMICGFEVDGLEYTFRDGLPLPTFSDGALPDTEILALVPARLGEEIRDHEGAVYLEGNFTLEVVAEMLYEDTSPETLDRLKRGCGVIVACRHGEGEIFTAATTEWVFGLAGGDPFTQQITRNVLDRFSGKRQAVASTNE